MGPAVQLATGEVVPPAVVADLDDVPGELVVLAGEAFEFALGREAAAVGVAEPVAVDVGHEAEGVLGADRTGPAGRFPDVLGGPDELGMGVADVLGPDHAAPQVPEQGPAGQGVIGVARHGAGAYRRPRPSGPAAAPPGPLHPGARPRLA